VALPSGGALLFNTSAGPAGPAAGFSAEWSPWAVSRLDPLASTVEIRAHGRPLVGSRVGQQDQVDGAEFAEPVSGAERSELGRDQAGREGRDADASGH
jgi:hypothetical protein